MASAAIFSWKALLQTAALLSVSMELVYGGGRTLSPQESSQFLQMFNRICSQSTPQQDGNTYYFCKQPEQQTIQLQLSHDAEVSPSETPKQVIFVQSPNYEYTHNVNLKGSAGNPQQTEIYVLPPQASHNLRLQDNREGLRNAAKPSLFYLSQEQGRENGNGVAPIGRPGGQQGGNGFQRPSSPPPNPSNPDVVGITAVGGGGGGYTQYGVPSINPRNQRNVLKTGYRVQ